MLLKTCSFSCFGSTKCAICLIKYIRHRHLPHHNHVRFQMVILFVIPLIMLILCTSKVNCELKPPKKLHRVIAGFYNYHPSYETDKPAPIKSMKSESKRKNTYHYNYHQEHKYGGQYKYHNYYDNGSKRVKSGNHHKPRHHTGYPKYKSKSVKKSHYNRKHNKATGYHYAPYWGAFSKLFETYVVLARKLAEYYGHKYNYPVNLLYWQIINVMFD